MPKKVLLGCPSASWLGFGTTARSEISLSEFAVLASRYWQDVLEDMNKSVLDVSERALKRLRPTVADVSRVLQHDSREGSMDSPTSVALEAMVASLLAL
ncbi:hypothetical protein DUNSADRAFT_18774, partial [Dunaliella salina]